MHLYGPYTFILKVSCTSTVVKIVLIGNLRWPSSCLYLLYFSATVLFICIKPWFVRNHLAYSPPPQLSHWSVVMIGLEKCCITFAYLQWLCHSGEQTVARGPLVIQWTRSFKQKRLDSFVHFPEISFKTHVATEDWKPTHSGIPIWSVRYSLVQTFYKPLASGRNLTLYFVSSQCFWWYALHYDASQMR